MSLLMPLKVSKGGFDRLQLVLPRNWFWKHHNLNLLSRRIYEGKSLALRILKVVATSGNRRLCKVLLGNAALQDSLLLCIRPCSAEIVDEMAPIHGCPGYIMPTHVPDIYRPRVLAGQAVDLFLHLYLCASKRVAQDMADKGFSGYARCV